MPRVRWSMFVLCLILNFIWIVTVTSDCWFENQKHGEGDEVVTFEPCLNCTCKQGALVCYLRVCTELPDPPPPGCIILHRQKSCCAELICRDTSIRNKIDARSEPEESNKKSSTSHCVENGTIYGTGSAMSSSSFCEHCFCIEGRQTCIKPKCLLNLEGCAPVFEDHSCCPTRYNCSGHSNYLTSTTTTQLPRDLIAPGGCMVSGEYYNDGSKVLGMGHSVCDNCYCLRGLLRCEPLSCAPPILGCMPVIKPGECCASSYNCNGTIQIQPEPFYGSYPTISKDYAKFRKEVQQKPSNKFDKLTTSSNFNNTFYVMAESTLNHRQSESVGTTRHIFSPSTKEPYFYNSKGSVTDFKFKPKETTIPNLMLAVRTRPSTNYKKNPEPNKLIQDENAHPKLYFTTKIPKTVEGPFEQSTPKQVRSSDYEEELGDDAFLSFVDSLFDNKINDSEPMQNTTKYSNEVTTTERNYREEVSTTPISNVNNPHEETPYLTDMLSTLFSTFANDVFSTTLNTEINNFTTILPSASEDVGTTTDSELKETTVRDVPIENKTFAPLTMVTTLVTTTDCTKSNSSNVTLENRNDIDTMLTDSNEIDYETFTTTTSNTEKVTLPLITTTEKDVTTVDMKSKVDEVDPFNKTSKIEAILNITLNKNKDYEDYDYNEPTLPPSLPNLRIIPFVAADALDAKKDDIENSIYPLPLERVTEAPPYSLFSPPSKTEGGFVPKEPPILLNYYDNIYHTTKIVDITSTTPSPLADLLITQKLNKQSCKADNREYQHSETVTAKDCVICVCFYGNIVCQKPECPLPNPGCRKITPHNTSQSCCSEIICDTQEVPSLLDRMDVTSNPQDIITIGERISSDSYKTKKVPSFNSLVDDSKPYIQYHSTTHATIISKNVSESATEPVTTTEGFNFNKVWDLLFYGETTTEKLPQGTAALVQETSSQRPETTTLRVVPVTVAKTTTSTTESVDVELNDAKNYNNVVHSSSNNMDSAVGVGLLKLAGCNIYGRMYRVGRIISELSGPCLECKCTEVGVQCTPLKC